MSESTLQAVQRILVDNLAIDINLATPQASISDDLGADSLDAAELIMSLEDEFAIEIDTIQAESLKTVGDLVSLVDSLKK
ncbi:MAG: acyl carrier protein [Coriobacteriaceae bacterium]|nr:acyl carrier protein [Coriobacteriaceae bacterium]